MVKKLRVRQPKRDKSGKTKFDRIIEKNKAKQKKKKKSAEPQVQQPSSSIQSPSRKSATSKSSGGGVSSTPANFTPIDQGMSVAPSLQKPKPTVVKQPDTRQSIAPSLQQPKPTVKKKSAEPQRPQSTVRALTPKESKNLQFAKEQEEFYNLPVGERFLRVAKGQGVPIAPDAVEFGVGSKIALFTPQSAVGAVKSIKPIAKTTKFLGKSQVGRFVLGAGTVAGRGVAGTFGGQELAKETLTKEERKAIGTQSIKKAVKAGFSAEREAVQKGGVSIPGTDATLSTRSIAFEVSPFLSPEKKSFSAGAREELKKQGLTGKKLETAVKTAQKARTVRATGELGGLLASSSGAEAFGRANTARAFSKLGEVPAQKAGITAFKTSFFPIAKAGVLEGAVGEAIQQRQRSEDLSLKKIAVSGGVGGVTAGVLGGTIVGLQAKQPLASGTIETIANIADPLEKPADLLQDVVEKGIRKSGGRVITPTITPSITETFTFGATPATTPTTVKKKTVSPKGKTVVPTFTPTPSSIFSFNPTPTPSPVTSRGGTPTPTPIPVPNPTVTPTPSTIITPAETPAETPTEIFTTTPTVTPTPTPTTVPVVTPIFRIPPPVPLSLPGLPKGSGGGLFGGGGSKFVNELALGIGALKNLTPNFQPSMNSRKKPKRKSPSIFGSSTRDFKNLNKTLFG